MVADLRVRCPDCKRQFRPRKGTRRRYCEDCRPPRLRPDDEPAPVPDQGPGPIEDACRAELERVDRLTTLEGAALLALARDADRLQGSARASAIRELVKLKPVAFEGTAAPQRDRLDDLAQRRRERRASA